jgi:flagellar biosynthesis/type III secretory pathway protein FliH
LGTVLSEMHKLTDLEIEVHPSLVEPLSAALRRNSAISRKLSLSIHPDERLSPGDAQISWGEGGLKVDAASRRAAVLEALGVILPDESRSEA